jgi:hypothetical protein
MSKKLTTEQFIERAQKKHGNIYDYSETTYSGFNSKIKIICRKHGPFHCNPSDHSVNGSGCQKCAGVGRVEDPLEYFIERAKIIHGEKYDYSKFIYNGAKIKSTIICPIHGEFMIHPNNHLNNHGCPNCRGDKISQTRISNNPDENIYNKLKKIHNNKYTYPDQPKIERTNKHKLKIICPIHGEFYQLMINHFYRGCGCESCGNNKISKGEKRIEDFLLENSINYTREKTFEKCINPITEKKLLFDFYLPDTNTVIEFQGKQHFEKSSFFKQRSGDLEELQKRDEIKRKYCILNDIKLIEINYNQFHLINDILSQLI